jgi:predicted DNA binding protein
MLDVTIDLTQEDCPFVAATADHEVAFSANHWEFDRSARETEVRALVEGTDRWELDDGLTVVRGHDALSSFDLLARQGDVAHVRAEVAETAAMSIVRNHDGYVTGPFYTEGGSERWQVGFDDAGRADGALAALDRDHEFEVVERDERGLDEVQGLVKNAGAAMTLIEGCQDLSDVERRTLEVAVDDGYFQSPRGATLGSLADEFGVSKPAVSKNLRRGQRKMIRRVVDALDELDGGTADRDDGE